MHAKKTAFIVEHDFIMATYLADRVIVFDGQPGIDAHANKPQSYVHPHFIPPAVLTSFSALDALGPSLSNLPPRLLTGCNSFLKNLDVTFRRDPTNFRPRINKMASQLDQEQKMNGNYVRIPLSPPPTYL